ncbi:MAG TPA: hypothetical protein VIY56_17845 [Vicinamibacterales bacterium]
MATTIDPPVTISAPGPEAHPLAHFLAHYQAARDHLIREQIEQEDIMNDGNASLGARADARANVVELTAVIAKLDNARTDFLVRVFTGVIPPSEALVARTIKLNKDLAKATVEANRPGTYIRIVTSYITAATQVITGNVPPAAEGDEEASDA